MVYVGERTNFTKLGSLQKRSNRFLKQVLRVLRNFPNSILTERVCFCLKTIFDEDM